MLDRSLNLAASFARADGQPAGWAVSAGLTPYPEAVAGRPISFDYSPETDVFHLAYAPNHRIHAPTVIFVPTSIHYPRGYCARVTGGRVTSVPGSDLLDVRNARTGNRVAVTVEPGACSA